MSSDLLHLTDLWQSLSVLVIGDAMLDCYLNGQSDRLCREAPVPVVSIHQRQMVPGGAANTATNVASLGGRTAFLSVIGTDTEGHALRQTLNQRGVITAHLLENADRETIAKQRVMAGSQILVRLDQGSTMALTPDLEQQVIQQLVEQFPQCDAIIVSDYGYGILTPRIIQALTDLQAQYPRTLVVDSKRLAVYQSVGVTAVKPNYEETIQLLGLPKQTTDRANQIAPHGNTLLKLTGAAIVAVTLDTEGAIVFERGQPPIRTFARPVPSQQTSGAGDTFIGALTLALAAGASTTMAASIATAATAIVVKQPGTTTCKAEELRQTLISGGQRMKLLLDQSDIATSIQQYRTAGQRIVFTNGCFDILHPGHVAYLTQAKALGDVLIVGVNSDESVRRLKGDGRPVNPLSDRLTVLSALSCVDHVIPFAESTPHHLIRIICPDIYVKGGDYTRETLPEADLVEELGGSVKILPYVDNRSTTRLIHHIRALHC